MIIILIKICGLMKQHENDKNVANKSRASLKEWRSEELFAEGKELAISHNGERYLLRITANNKLILTK